MLCADVKLCEKEDRDVLCVLCQGDFVELVKESVEPEIDS